MVSLRDRRGSTPPLRHSITLEGPVPSPCACTHFDDKVEDKVFGGMSRVPAKMSRVGTGHVTGRCSEKARLYWFVTVSRLQPPRDRSRSVGSGERLEDGRWRSEDRGAQGAGIAVNLRKPRYTMINQGARISNQRIMSHIKLMRFLPVLSIFQILCILEGIRGVPPLGFW
jgi:hypothetical protein